MPTYQYKCSECEHEFEELQSMSAKPLRKCPKCKKRKLVRLIGGGIYLKKGNDPNEGKVPHHIRL